MLITLDESLLHCTPKGDALSLLCPGACQAYAVAVGGSEVVIGWLKSPIPSNNGAPARLATCCLESTDDFLLIESVVVWVVTQDDKNKATHKHTKIFLVMTHLKIRYLNLLYAYN